MSFQGHPGSVNVPMQEYAQMSEVRSSVTQRATTVELVVVTPFEPRASLRPVFPGPPINRPARSLAILPTLLSLSLVLADGPLVCGPGSV